MKLRIENRMCGWIHHQVHYRAILIGWISKLLSWTNNQRNYAYMIEHSWLEIKWEKVWSWKSSKLEKIEVGRVNITIKYMLIFRNTFQWCKFYVCFIWKDIDTYILVIKSHVFPFKNNYNNDIANFVAYCLIYKISNFPT